MSDELLKQAMHLVRKGHTREARALLRQLIEANRQDVAAWLWYAETCETPAERRKTLQTCLKFNPSHPQVRQALAACEETSTTQTEEQPAEAAQEAPAEPEPPAVQVVSSKPAAIHEEDTPAPAGKDFGKEAVQLELPIEAGQVEAFPEDEPTAEPAPLPIHKPGAAEQASEPACPWYKAWWAVLTHPSVEKYESLLTPLSQPRRAYFWMMITGVIAGIIWAFIQSGKIELWLSRPAFQELMQASGFDFRTLLMAVLVLLVPLSALLNFTCLMLGAAFQNLLAGLFGGKGNYERSVYLLGAVFAPLSILAAVLSFFPYLLIGVLVYAIMLNLRTLQAAHSLSTGKALGVILLSGMAVLLLVSIAVIVLLVAILSALLPPEIQEALRELVLWPDWAVHQFA